MEGKERENESLEKELKKVEHVTLDNADMINSENPSIFDLDEQMRFYDAYPVEEINDKVRDEDGQFKADQKATSSSERKFRPDK